LLDQREDLVNMGNGAGAGLKAQRAEAAQRAVTERILALADQAGNGAALIDSAGTGPRPGQACVITWPQFACMVRAAARGLSRRGLREGDTAGIFVADAVSHAVSVHAVRAAGAIAVPVRPAQTAADIAAQLKPCRARVLITSAALAGLAVQAAERCWVRQVFAFGEAEETTPFSSLLDAGRPGGTQDHARRAGTQAALDPAGLGELNRRDVVVAVPPCGDPDTYTSLLDEALAAGSTIVAAPLAQVAATVRAYQATAAITSAGRTSQPAGADRGLRSPAGGSRRRY
jgi:acyl-CoA synthetase (AMP-forming)/AMP-acid ligase II